MRLQMERKQDLSNIKWYVQKEQENEQAYRDRFDASNKRMAANANNLVNQLDIDRKSKQHSMMIRVQ